MVYTLNMLGSGRYLESTFKGCKRNGGTDHARPYHLISKNDVMFQFQYKGSQQNILIYLRHIYEEKTAC